MTTIDVTKMLPALYKGKPEWVELDVPVRNVIRLSGSGSPNAPEFAEAVGALYSVAYTLKFALKKAGKDDFKVPPLEGLWDLRRTGTIDDSDWVAIIPLPDFVTASDIASTITAVAVKKPNARLSDIAFEKFDEGLSLQYLFVGPYRAEAPVIADLHSNVIPSRGFVETGWHHEIYLSDPSRTAPEKLKTLLRQPVARKKP